MDDFLTALYEEEQEKLAAADMGQFMGTLPVDELEDFLGLTKSAVAGPPNPELPTGADKLEKEKKQTEEALAKKEASDNRIRKIAAVPMSLARGTLSGAGTGAVIGGGIGALRGAISDDSTALRGLGRGAAIGAGVGGGGYLGAVGLSRLAGGKFGKLFADQTQGKISPEDMADMAERWTNRGDRGFGRGAATYLGGLGGGMAAGGVAGSKLTKRLKSKKKEMETTASVKADIVLRTMNSTVGAPPHIKQAAARFAGKQIAKLAQEDKFRQGGDWIDRKTQFEQRISENKPVNMTAGALLGGLGGAAIGGLGKTVKPVIGGGLGGAALGAAAGYGLSRLARSRRGILKKITDGGEPEGLRENLIARGQAYGESVPAKVGFHGTMGGLAGAGLGGSVGGGKGALIGAGLGALTGSGLGYAGAKLNKKERLAIARMKDR